jgi:hypothetical protein
MGGGSDGLLGGIEPSSTHETVQGSSVAHEPGGRMRAWRTASLNASEWGTRGVQRGNPFGQKSEALTPKLILRTAHPSRRSPTGVASVSATSPARPQGGMLNSKSAVRELRSTVGSTSAAGPAMSASRVRKRKFVRDDCALRVRFITPRNRAGGSWRRAMRSAPPLRPNYRSIRQMTFDALLADAHRLRAER